MEIIKQQDVVCVHCGHSFTSTDAADFEGSALCEDCLKRRKDVGHKVDEQIAERRKNNPLPSPQVPLHERMPRSGWIDRFGNRR